VKYWRIAINHGKGSSYTVCYKSFVDISLQNVAVNAVRDGDLIDVDLRYVEKVEEISKEEYLQLMWE
jgi:hypothetical protein